MKCRGYQIKSLTFRMRDDITQRPQRGSVFYNYELNK